MFLIWTQTHLCITYMRERDILARRRCTYLGSCILLLIHLYRGSFFGFSSPWGFPKINLFVLLCDCTCISFSDPFAYGYDVIMLNVIRYGITIKKLTWYHSYPERSLYVAETLLQLQLLKIRVLCLKTLED